MAEGGDVFVLDMGAPVKIMDLARRMVRLSGFSVRDDAHPDGDIEIAISGMRPGEKLYEELLIGDNPSPTAHARIMKAHEEFDPWNILEPVLQRLQYTTQHNQRGPIKTLLGQLVKVYTPSSATENP